MGYTYTTEEKDIIDSALKFANMKFDASTKAEDVFEILPVRYRGGVSANALKHDQTCLRAILDAIVENPTGALRRWEEDINDLLGKAASQVTLQFQGGKIVQSIARELIGVEAWCGYAVMLILRDHSSRAVLRSCELCKAYFPSYGSKGGGPKPKYCSPEHSKLADKSRASERVMEWRLKRDRKKKTPPKRGS